MLQSMGSQSVGHDWATELNLPYLDHVCESVSFSIMCDSLWPWTIAYQASLPMGFSKQEYWSGLPFPPPGYLPDPGIKPRSPVLHSHQQSQRPRKMNLKVRHIFTWCVKHFRPPTLKSRWRELGQGAWQGFQDSTGGLKKKKKKPAISGRPETRIQYLGQEDPPEEGMATDTTILAWRIPWTEEPGGLQSIRSHRVKHNWSDLAHT